MEVIIVAKSKEFSSDVKRIPSLKSHLVKCTTIEPERLSEEDLISNIVIVPFEYFLQVEMLVEKIRMKGHRPLIAFVDDRACRCSPPNADCQKTACLQKPLNLEKLEIKVRSLLPFSMIKKVPDCSA